MIDVEIRTSYGQGRKPIAYCSQLSEASDGTQETGPPTLGGFRGLEVIIE